MSIMYHIGRVVGKNPEVWTRGAAAVVVLAIGYSSLNGYFERKEAAARQENAKALAAQQKAQRQAMCTDGIDDLKAQAMDLLSRGRPGPAANVLGACESFMQDPQAKTLLAEARKARQAEELKEQKKQAAEQARVAAAEKARKKREGVTIGMTQQNVLDSSWGKPRDVNRTVSAYGVREQWVYDGGYLYFKDGILTTIQN